MMHHLILIDQGAFRDFVRSDAYIDLIERYGLGEFRFSFIRSGQSLDEEILKKEAQGGRGDVIIVRRHAFSRKINGFAEELHACLLNCGYPPCRIKMIIWQDLQNVTSIHCSQENAPLKEGEAI